MGGSNIPSRSVRSLLVIAVFGTVGTLRAQVAVGAFSGMSEDRVWQTGLVHVGALGEFRMAFIPSAVFRATLAYSPVKRLHHEYYSQVQLPEQVRWLSAKTDHELRSMDAALDLKFPFEGNGCVGGYYRGTYVLAGVGLTQRWENVDRWEQDVYGAVTTVRVSKANGGPILRAGFGGEWNFSWGGPFVEGTVTVFGAGTDGSAIPFPGSGMIAIGYRYSFARPEPLEELEN